MVNEKKSKKIAKKLLDAERIEILYTVNNRNMRRDKKGKDIV